MDVEEYMYNRLMIEYRTIEDLPGAFTLLDKLGNRAELKRHEVSYAERTLGVCISMDGNEDAEMQRLKDHALLFADQMRTHDGVRADTSSSRIGCRDGLLTGCISRRGSGFCSKNSS